MGSSDWRRLHKEKSVDGLMYFYQSVRSREGHTSKGLRLSEDEVKSTIDPSPRSKKQHLRQIVFTHNENEAMMEYKCQGELVQSSIY